MVGRGNQGNGWCYGVTYFTVDVGAWSKGKGKGVVQFTLKVISKSVAMMWLDGMAYDSIG